MSKPPKISKISERYIDELLDADKRYDNAARQEFDDSILDSRRRAFEASYGRLIRRIARLEAAQRKLKELQAEDKKSRHFTG